MAGTIHKRIGLAALLAASCLGFGCGSAPPPPAAVPEEPEVEVAEPEPASPPPSTTSAQDAAPHPPLSTASYEEALSTPEALNVHDGRAHLSDLQLTNPMREVIGKCRVPRRAKVVAKVAVQGGRAIGVSVFVAFDKPKVTARTQSRAAAKQEAKASAKVAECIDRAVRVLNWPPSPRRDSFTTEF